MNKVCLTGRITADLELRYTNSNIAYTRFILAVNRNFKDEKGERQADFISCVAWKERAEMICKHLKKGSLIAVEGRIQTGSYEDTEGTKRYMTDIIVENITFLESKKDSRPEPEYNGPSVTSEEIAKNRTKSPYDFQQTQMNEDPYGYFGDRVSIDDNFLD